ncbi:SDR family oxidoreductase [Brachybacterium sp. YJGR34]|uniref:SDR family oxidoreductase n=1 Tax=Brachybacterium sp. YJGR34 TaxID=2059911 RepID=UPI0013006C5D|nr:NAD(P)H-binding protein [Brachybacterium sp. YJGR34]
MDVAVIGATGTLGRLIVPRLEQAGHQVRALSRSTGVDALTGEGLEEAVAGADVIVDTLNHLSLRPDPAISFFTRAAQNISRAAEQGGVRRIVCVSIAGAADPAVNRFYGYYRGKAAQEQVYGMLRTPATILRSTQWFELAEMFVAMTTLGPLAVLPAQRMAPVAADSVAARAVRAIEEADGAADEDRVITVRGPEEMTTAPMVRRILAVRGELGGKSPRRLLELPFLGRSIARGGLVPADAEVDGVTLEDWLAAAA